MKVLIPVKIEPKSSCVGVVFGDLKQVKEVNKLAHEVLELYLSEEREVLLDDIKKQIKTGIRYIEARL